MGEHPAGSRDCEPPFVLAGAAGAASAAQRREDQDPAPSDGHIAGGRGYPRERGLEEELDGQRQREVRVRPALSRCAPGPWLECRSPRRALSSAGRPGNREPARGTPDSGTRRPAE
jgi:hypothetical protein